MPESDICTAQMAALFDHLVRALLELERHVEAEALPVFRSMISATLIGIWIGSSAAFSPLRMRSIYPAAWEYCSPKSPP